jgi:hypothetical protein
MIPDPDVQEFIRLGIAGLVALAYVIYTHHCIRVIVDNRKDQETE